MAEWINDPQGREEIEKVTKELKLPVWKANHKGKFRDFWNELWDKIEDYILKLKGDTEKNSKGLNDRLISAVGKHDGDFPIANAVVGNVYYSELTKKYYKCKVAGPAPMPNGNFIDMSILENLNRLENLIKVKRSGDCNVVHNDCTIAFEPWSNTLLKNRPIGDNNPAGILISFYHGRRVQLYISGNTMYTRVNQGAEDYNSWLQWVKCSNI